MHDYPVQEAKLRGDADRVDGTAADRTADQLIRPSSAAWVSTIPNTCCLVSADLLRVVTDAAGKPILAVIVGHRRVRSQANVPEDVYVRRPNDNQSWLAEGSVQVDADPALLARPEHHEHPT